MEPPRPLTIAAFREKTPDIDALKAFYTSLHESATRTESIFTCLSSLSSIESRISELSELSDLSASLPLYGVPFVIKDNIHVPSFPTHAACPEFSYTSTEAAPCVSALLSAGAILLGKTNMDQFACGLVGTRSPYGTPKNPWNKDYIPGGSSSGSAVAVAAGLCVFSLGTDTAGSGRVPAAMCGVTGLKMSRGVVKTEGVVPAVKRLDCVSVFANGMGDAEIVGRIVSEGGRRVDWEMKKEKIRIGILTDKELQVDADEEGLSVYREAVRRLVESGAEKEEIEFEKFNETGRLLYGGAFVAERYEAVGERIEDLVEENAKGLNGMVRDIVLGGKDVKGWDLSRDLGRVDELRWEIEAKIWSRIDVMVVPSIARVVTVQQVEENEREGVENRGKLNGMLGRYTNFVNLLDLCAVAVPVQKGLKVPRGVTLIGMHGTERIVMEAGRRVEETWWRQREL